MRLGLGIGLGMFRAAMSAVQPTLTLSISPTNPVAGQTVTITGAVTGNPAPTAFDSISVTIDGATVTLSGTGLTRTFTAASGQLSISASVTNIHGTAATTLLGEIGPGVFAEVTSLVLNAAATGDTLADVVEWGTVSLNAGDVVSETRQQRVNSGAWAAYLGSTSLSHPDVWEVRQVWAGSLGAALTVTSAAMTVVGELVYPVLRSGPTKTTMATASTSWTTLGIPAGVQVGDTLVAEVVGNASSLTISAPGDWTVVAQAFNSPLRLMILTKTATGSDTLTLTPSVSSTFAARVYAYQGAVSITASASASTGAGTAPNSASLTMGAAAATRWQSVVAHRGSGTAISAGSPPSGYSWLSASGDVASSGTTSSQSRLHSAYLDSYATTEDPGAFSQAVDNPISYTLALRVV